MPQIRRALPVLVGFMVGVRLLNDVCVCSLSQDKKCDSHHRILIFVRFLHIPVEKKIVVHQSIHAEFDPVLWNDIKWIQSSQPRLIMHVSV